MGTVLWPLAGMMLTQATAVLVFLSVPVMATEIARDAGLDPNAIGIYTSVVFAAFTAIVTATGDYLPAFLAVGGLTLAAAVGVARGAPPA